MPQGLTQVTLEGLTPEHFACLERALQTILSTNLATETFAQVVDGIPTHDVYREYYGYRRRDFDNNIRSSQPSLQTVESYRQNFSIDSLQLDAKIAQAYQDTKRGTREFNLRLIEVLAVLCHDIAVHLYIQYKGGLRKPDPEAIYQEIPAPELPPGIPRVFPKPRLAELFHGSYQNWEQYPNGVGDIVGYWAEYRLFGGVVLFDRGENGSACNDAFIHPVGRYLIFRLSDTQIQRHVDALLSALPPNRRDEFDLRFRAEKYASRIDPFDAMDLHIYRDNKRERKIPETRPVRCVGRGEDMPGYEESLRDLARRCGRE